jgi:hypothetical protein
MDQTIPKHLPENTMASKTSSLAGLFHVDVILGAISVKNTFLTSNTHYFLKYRPNPVSNGPNDP